ncbi:2-desacetyl-2-hydroxyethyl bacteriochlorophyllide A dehydrogenase [Actinomadura madurae]|uniref:2-desacetyl-2-hydroxyethyl bacteriochlorophyllide A dehydrogenase n=1 Tax=Actinomadura madurae TaxID=1993 RepID=A0A1I5GSN7_9ACTN|nr:alcohol dehydrogenase catalytic domain-containing protein [Actinomadura madurae]SFO38591.1 2-desacetyl-2-hydroxyethyl bacteriochlorophyllide A dehydrogenase [Actinomadura madurae]
MTESSVRGRALVVRSPGDVVLQERVVPPPGSGEVLVEPHFVGLCGTDLEIIDGDLDPAYVRYPLVLGHEWSGKVLATGEQVDGLAADDPVVVEGIVPCSFCHACRSGRTNLCENYDELGFTLDGAAGPAVRVPAYLVHRLSGGIPLDSGALVEPAAVVLRALSETDLVPGMSVLVIGDGTVALLAAHLVRLWSPSGVTVSGRRPEQEDLAVSMGADRFTVKPPQERAYDIVIEAAGSTEACETAFRSARRGGQVLLLGISGHGETARLPVDDVVNNDLRIRGSFSYTAAAWAQTVRLLNSGIFQPSRLVTHRFRLDRFASALSVLADPSSGEPRGKVLIEMRGEG